MDSARSPVSIDELLAHADWVRGLARALVADEASADDVAQETWLAAIERPPRSAGQPKHWLAVVTRNVARKLSRKKRSDASLERAAATSELLPATDDVVARAALQQRVVAAVMRLAEPYRSTLLQRFFDRMAPRAIAAAAQVPVETVKTRLKRGLEMVRRDLASDFEREGKAWPAALLMLKRLAQPAAPATAAGAIGVLVMTKGAKLAIAAVVVAVAAPATWWWLRKESRVPPTETAVVKSDEAPAVAPPSVARAAEVVRTPEAQGTRASDATAPAADPVDPTATGTIRGRVVDLEKHPVAGAVVYAGDQRDGSFKDHDSFFSGASGRIQASYPPVFAARATTAADGTFELAGLDRQRTWSVGAGDHVAGCAFASPIRFDGADLTKIVELECEGGISFSGRCAVDGDAPHRLSMVMISVKKDEPSVRPNVYADYVLNPDVQDHDDGTFQTMAVPGHWFTVQAAAFPDSKSNSLEPEEGGFKEIRIPWTRIPDDQHEWRLDLQFERTVALAGRIVATDGSPAHLADRLVPRLAEAEFGRQSRETVAILAFDQDPRRDANALRDVYFNSGGFWTGASHAYGTIDLDHDRYTVERPPPAAKFVAFLARNELLGCAEIVGGAAPDVPIDLALLPEEPLVRAVHFTATSALDGKPLEQVQLDLFCFPAFGDSHRGDEMLRESDKVRENLPITHELSLPIGTAAIRTYKHGWMNDHLVAEIPPGEEPLDLTLALTPAGKTAIRGEVVDEDGKPVADVLLRVYRRSDLHPIWEQTGSLLGCTDVAGRFELKGLAAAEYVVSVDPHETNPQGDLRDLSDLAERLGPAVIVASATEKPETCRLVLPLGVACTLDVSFADGVRRGVRLRALDDAGLPLIDDSNHGWYQYWRGSGRIDFKLPRRATTLDLRGANGESKTIRFDPTLSSSATVILPAK
jgi:RNA polymerase sigma factor (sigma-70 family)